MAEQRRGGRLDSGEGPVGGEEEEGEEKEEVLAHLWNVLARVEVAGGRLPTGAEVAAVRKVAGGGVLAREDLGNGGREDQGREGKLVVLLFWTEMN